MVYRRFPTASEPENQFPKRPLWHTSAACSDDTPTLYDDEEQASYPPSEVRCWTCPVQDICLAVALNEGLTGIWGGTTTKQRRSLLRRRTRQRCPVCQSQFIIPMQGYPDKHEVCMYCGASWNV